MIKNRELKGTPKTVDLSGEWGVWLGKYEGECKFQKNVILPGTLDENSIGEQNDYDDRWKLSRKYVYRGPAVYQRKVFIPDDFFDKKVELLLERSRITEVWINGKKILKDDVSLPVPQRYDLTDYLLYGQENLICVQADNSYPNLPANIIQMSSMATDESQTNWNGILGKIELRIHEKLFFDYLKVFPRKDLHSVDVEIGIVNALKEDFEGYLQLKLGKEKIYKTFISVCANSDQTVRLTKVETGEIRLWSEFEPNLYEIEACLPNGEIIKTKFGMRVFSVEEDSYHFTINGKKTFLRMETNSGIFPLTGYAPMTEDFWEKLFTNYKRYGINAVRFHSWCPSESAFAVADRLGLYVQAELSCWDCEMFNTQEKQDYYSAEARAILKEYANHPSFVLFSLGNELFFNEKTLPFAESLLEELETKDPTRLYAYGSNADFGTKKPARYSQFFTAMEYRGQMLRGTNAGMTGFVNQQRPSTLCNYNDALERLHSETKLPAYSHEVGQFQVFPDILTELEQYNGVLEPRNISCLKKICSEKKISEKQIEQFILTSGKLSFIGYRLEAEAALRSKNMAGMALLSIQDFTGQGTALVGMMNAFGDPKPYCFADPKNFRQFFSECVVLVETEKFVWENDEVFHGNILVANYSSKDLNGKINFEIYDGDILLKKGEGTNIQSEQGSLEKYDTFSFPLHEIRLATKLTLKVSFEEIRNEYSVWVYPKQIQKQSSQVYICKTLDEKALHILKDGGKVMLAPAATKNVLPHSLTGMFTTSFWSSFFENEPQPMTMGILVDSAHPAFSSFPTEYHTDMQWWPMVKFGRAVILDDFMEYDDFERSSIIRVVDGFKTMRNLSLLFEARVGEGKLMVSSLDLEHLSQDYPEASALRNSILAYMESELFVPGVELSPEAIQRLVMNENNDERINLLDPSKGGLVALCENTVTLSDSAYDLFPQNRLLEINDGRYDLINKSRSWIDGNLNNGKDDVHLCLKFKEKHTVDSIDFVFFEDNDCKAPSAIHILRKSGTEYIAVENQSLTSSFVKGKNTIQFDAVITNELYLRLKHSANKNIAISEIFVMGYKCPDNKKS